MPSRLTPGVCAAAKPTRLGIETFAAPIRTCAGTVLLGDMLLTTLLDDDGDGRYYGWAPIPHVGAGCGSAGPPANWR